MLRETPPIAHARAARAAVILLLLLAPRVSDAATIVVSSTGKGQYTSIQQAIDASNNGDTILVLNGTYSEGINGVASGNIYGGVLYFPHSVTLIGQSVNGVIVSSAIPSGTQRTGALLLTQTSSGAYTPQLQVSCMTLLYDNPGTEGGTYSYTALSEGTNYNVQTGSVLVQNVVFRLQQSAAKSVAYLNDNNLVIRYENVTVDFGSASTGDFTYINYTDGSSEIHDSIVYNTNGNFDYSGSIGVAYSDTYNSPSLGSTDYIFNPLFVSAAGLNWQLQSTSLAIGAGDPASTYNNANGTRDTMGAFGGECLGASSFQTLTVTPASLSIAPGGSQTFSASGGSGTGYTWTVPTNASTGGIGSSTGAYVAGHKGSVTDVVQVVDSLQNVGTATVTVGPGITVAAGALTIGTGPSINVAPRQSVTLTAAGGSGTGYAWSPTALLSGGTISSSGAYVAGATPNKTDSVLVVDSLGNSATLQVNVGPGVTLTPTTDTISYAATITFTASGGSGTGYTYSISTNASGGMISTSGLYLAGLTGGVTDIVTVKDSLQNTATATVNIEPVIVVTPTKPTSAPRATQTLSASGGTGIGFTWFIGTNPSGGSITKAGVYTAGPIGNVTDVAAVEDSGGDIVTVPIAVGPGITITPATTTVPPQGGVTFAAAGGSGTGFVWTLTAAPSGGTISKAGAYAAGTTPNVVDVASVIDSLGNTALVRVSVGAGVSIGAPGVTPPRGSQTLTASGGSGQGYAWTLLSAASGGSITSGGAYTAGKTGNVSDVAQVMDSLGNAATVSIVVGPGLTLSPPGSNVDPMGLLSFTVSGGSGSGYVYSLAANPSGGTISSTGNYQAGPTGNEQDIVSVTDSLLNTATATVSVGAVIAVSPASTMIPPRGTLILSAAGGSGSGYTWSLSAAPSGGTITPTGDYTAGSTGGVTDVATVKDSLGNKAVGFLMVGPGISIAASMGVTIGAGPSVHVAPAQSVTFSASGGSGKGYLWSASAAPSGGNVTSDGGYTAGSTPNKVDVVTVIDSFGNSASISIDVGVGVSLTPSSATVAPLGSVAFQASGGTGTGYTYAFVLNASKATLSSAGVYRAGITGGVSDVISAADSLGNSTTATVAVGPILTVTPSQASVPPRGTLTLTAAGGGPNQTWALLMSPSGGNITSTGVYTAGATGDVTDIATISDALGNSATATIAVGPDITISPSPVSVAPLASITFVASGGSGTGYTWSLNAAPSGGSISSSGVYFAGSTPNVADVVAVSDSLGNNATLSLAIGAGVIVTSSATTTPPGGTATFTATGGSGTGFTWSISAPSGGSISNEGGYTAGSIGNVTDVIRATDSLGNTSTSSINVGPGVTLTPPAASVAPLGAIAFQAGGGSQTGYVYSLSASLSGGSISSTGVYKAGSIGGVTDVVLVVDSLQNRATASVTVGPVINVLPANAAVAPNGSLRLSATGGSGSGYVWSLKAAPSGGTITGSGQYTAGSVGNVTDVVLVQDSLGDSTTAPVMVGPGVTLNPAAVTVEPRASVTFQANGGSKTGYVYSITTNRSGASISGSVYQAGPAGGVMDVITVVDSLQNTATAFVSVGPVIAVTPLSAMVPPRGTQDMMAAGGSGAGFTWALMASPSGGSITPNGVYTAGAVGSVTDVAVVKDSLGNSAAASLLVGPAISIAGGPVVMVAPGQGVSFTATGGSGQGYKWSLNANPSGGTITAAGSYTAGSTPNTVDNITVVDSLGNTASVQAKVGPGVTLTPAESAVPPMGAIAFQAAGGSGTGFVYSLPTNLSGGTITTAGEYQAGSVGGVSDVVQAVDSLGNKGTVTVAVGGVLTVTPATATVPPRGTQMLTAAGGSGASLSWSLTTNLSGGSITSAGVYTAGGNGNVTDVVTVKDSLGNTATASLAVGPAVTVTPATANAVAGAQVTFTAAGGSGIGFKWSLTGNASGGQITNSGVYTAGSHAGVSDTVEVMDSLGNTATAKVQVTEAAIVPVKGCGCAGGGSTNVLVLVGALLGLGRSRIRRRRLSE